MNRATLLLAALLARAAEPRSVTLPGGRETVLTGTPVYP